MKPTVRAIGALIFWTVTSVLVAVVPIILLAVMGLDKPTAKSLMHLAVGLASLFTAWKLVDQYLDTQPLTLIGSTDSLRYHGPWILPASLGLAALGVGIAVLLHRHVPGFGSMPDIEVKGVAGFLAVAILAPLAEELVFRGVILRILLGGGHRPWAAFAISAALFALMHGYPVRFFHTLRSACSGDGSPGARGRSGQASSATSRSMPSCSPCLNPAPSANCPPEHSSCSAVQRPSLASTA